MHHVSSKFLHIDISLQAEAPILYWQNFANEFSRASISVEFGLSFDDYFKYERKSLLALLRQTHWKFQAFKPNFPHFSNLN